MPSSSTTTGSVRRKRIACGNRPPRTAFPTLPELPGVPDVVNPDRWLEASFGLHVVRTVRRNGTVSVESLGLLCL
jgi:hypothetical protein